ncbi:hypothetical protein JW711_05995 [Candidatus Woesearchaeota archaeon]|nr:hypothetical protein [Candidatus Woesearchaeota archaeon]
MSESLLEGLLSNIDAKAELERNKARYLVSVLDENRDLLDRVFDAEPGSGKTPSERELFDDLCSSVRELNARYSNFGTCYKESYALKEDVWVWDDLFHRFEKDYTRALVRLGWAEWGKNELSDYALTHYDLPITLKNTVKLMFGWKRPKLTPAEAREKYGITPSYTLKRTQAGLDVLNGYLRSVGMEPLKN